MFDQQQKTTKSALETQNLIDKSPDDPNSTSNEDVEVLIAKGSENSQCPSKID